MFGEDTKPSGRVSFVAGRQPALGIIITPFKPAVDFLNLLAKFANLGKRFRLEGGLVPR